MIGIPVLEDREKKPLAAVTVGFGIPLHPKVMLACVPKTVGPDGLSMIHETTQAYSVGHTGSCRRVVIPLPALDKYGPGDVAKRIRSLRAGAIKMKRTMVRLNNKTRELYRRLGLEP